MGYNYEDQRHNVFTEDGQRQFLNIRDRTHNLLDEAGACRVQEMISGCTGDTWTMLACIDRLEELGEIRKIDQGMVAGQHEVYVRNY